MVTITGATGNTGSKLANVLLSKGIKTRVIGRSAQKLESLKSKGAEAFVGDQLDSSFLANAFKGSEIVYFLIPPKMDASDVRSYYKEAGKSAVKAIIDSGLRKLVFLSSLGADKSAGTGPVLSLRDVELALKELPIDIAVLRPGFFMENILWNIPLIKHQKIMGNSADPEVPFPIIATRDIAAKAADLISDGTFRGFQVFELFGDKLNYKKITQIIGEKIDNPKLPYIRFPEQDSINALKSMGLSQSVAESYAELSRGLSQKLMEPIYIDPSSPNTPTRFVKFVEDVFYPAFQQA